MTRNERLLACARKGLYAIGRMKPEGRFVASFIANRTLAKMAKIKADAVLPKPAPGGKT